MEEMKFWTPKNNEWNNFAIYKGNREVMRGSVSDVSTSITPNEMRIDLKNYSNLGREKIFEILNHFKQDLLTTSGQREADMNCNMIVFILATRWFEI